MIKIITCGMQLYEVFTRINYVTHISYIMAYACAHTHTHIHTHKFSNTKVCRQADAAVGQAVQTKNLLPQKVIIEESLRAHTNMEMVLWSVCCHGITTHW